MDKTTKLRLEAVARRDAKLLAASSARLTEEQRARAARNIVRLDGGGERNDDA